MLIEMCMTLLDRGYLCIVSKSNVKLQMFLFCFHVYEYTGKISQVTFREVTVRP